MSQEAVDEWMRDWVIKTGASPLDVQGALRALFPAWSKELQTKYLPAKLLPALELVQPREMKGVLTVTEGLAMDEVVLIAQKLVAALPLLDRAVLAMRWMSRVFVWLLHLPAFRGFRKRVRLLWDMFVVCKGENVRILELQKTYGTDMLKAEGEWGRLTQTFLEDSVAPALLRDMLKKRRLEEAAAVDVQDKTAREIAERYKKMTARLGSGLTTRMPMDWLSGRWQQLTNALQRQSGSDSDEAEVALEVAAAQDIVRMPSEDVDTRPLHKRLFGSNDGAEPGEIAPA
jgi:hypothetical protein